MKQKKTPTALDYLVVHHVCRTYLKSLNHIANGQRDDLISELYEESIQFLTHFIKLYDISSKGINSETRRVLSIMKLSVSRQEPDLADMASPSRHVH